MIHRLMGQHTESTDKYTCLWSINLQQRRQEYAWGKTIFSLSGGGETGQLHVKE